MKRLWLSFLLTALTLAPAQAQSLFATRGLGVPILPLDARSRALGGIGLALPGLNTSMVSPAEMAGIGRRGVAAALQPTSETARFAGLKGSISAARFPLIRILYPVSDRLIFGIGYGGYLDQSWAVQSTGREILGGDTLDTKDLARSVGGVAQGQLAASYTVRSGLAVGAAVVLFTGNLQREISRTFPDTATSFTSFDARVRWDYSGPAGILGARWDASRYLRLGASLMVPGKLKAKGVQGLARDTSFSMPTRLGAAVSQVFSRDLFLTVGAEHTWQKSNAAGAPDRSIPADTWRVGGGLEYAGLGSGSKSYPIRLGGHYADLPYRFPGETVGKEWSGAIGIGFRLAGDQAGPLAVVDAAIERGGRKGLASSTYPDGLTESFWRFTFSLALFSR